MEYPVNSSEVRICKTFEEMKHRILVFFLSLSLVLGVLAPAGPALAAEPISITINDSLISFDVPPAMIEGRVLVPMRAIFEELGVVPEWDLGSRTVSASNGEEQIRLTIGKKVALVGESEVTLDVPGQLVRGRTLVPIRFVAESLGAAVAWNGENNRVEIIAERFKNDSGVVTGDEREGNTIIEGMHGALTGPGIRNLFTIEERVGEDGKVFGLIISVNRKDLPEAIRDKATMVQCLGTVDGAYSDESIAEQLMVKHDWIFEVPPQTGSVLELKASVYTWSLVMLRDRAGDPLAYFVIQ